MKRAVLVLIVFFVIPSLSSAGERQDLPLQVSLNEFLAQANANSQPFRNPQLKVGSTVTFIRDQALDDKAQIVLGKSVKRADTDVTVGCLLIGTAGAQEIPAGSATITDVALYTNVSGTLEGFTLSNGVSGKCMYIQKEASHTVDLVPSDKLLGTFIGDQMTITEPPAYSATPEAATPPANSQETTTTGAL